MIDGTEIYKLANELAKNYTWDLYKRLYELCEENDLFWAEQTNEETETLEFWIEDDHWICK